MSSSSPIQLPFAQSHAFIIGINAYQNGISRLKTAVKDAQDMAELLGDIHGYQVHTAYDASKTDMLTMFDKMKTLVHEEDRVIFYFAGHGIALDSEKDPEGFLVPVDANQGDKETLIPMDYLHETLHAMSCNHGLLILDCCFAGAFKWSTGFRDVVFDLGDMLYEERFYQFVKHPAWQVITSTAHDQKAIDIIDNQTLGMRETTEENFNSPFALALRQAINLEGKADIVRGKRSDGVITASELYLYVREIVGEMTKREGKRQVPSIFNLSKHDKGEFIFLHPGHRLNLAKAPEINPYKGLDTYEDTDSKAFFGREEEIREMTNKFLQSPLLVITAPSGQGKSSTVKAGLIPFLRRRYGYEAIHIVRPGTDPQLAIKNIPELDGSFPQILMIDQYEEFFGEESSPMAQQWFDKRMVSLLALAKESHLKLIVTMRSDFEWRLKASAFGQAFWIPKQIHSFLYRLPPMALDDLRHAIVKPAWTVAYDFESDDMVDHILEDVNHSPGALPMLSFALYQLFELRDRQKRRLTWAAYEQQLGGIEGALTTYADAVYEGMPDDAHRDFMRKMMLRMVQLNDGSYVRRRVYLKVATQRKDKAYINELNYPDYLDDLKDNVIEILVKKQLLRYGKDELGPFIEPIHDSLINFWPRCLRWIQAFGKEHLILQRQLWNAVVEYHQWIANEIESPEDEEFEPPLWDHNPKLQQVQLAVTDSRDLWLCHKKRGKKPVSDLAFMLWERYPTDLQLMETRPWNWFFQLEDDRERYEKVRDQMDHWLNEEELAFVKESFEEQMTEIAQLKAERNEALKAKELALQRQEELQEMTHRMGLQLQTVKQQFQDYAARDLRLIQQGRKPDLHLLIVAIDEYPVFASSLHGCVSDAQNIAHAFLSQSGKLYEEVHLHLLTDAYASRSEIFKRVNQIRQEAGEFDFVIMLLSGNGYAGTSLQSIEHSTTIDGAFISYNEQLEPKEGELVALEEVRGPEFFDALRDFRAKVILLLDFKGGHEFLRPLIAANHSEDIQELSHQIFALSGTSLGETPHLMPGTSATHGVFASAILSCFFSQQGDLDGNEMIYLDELFRYTLDFVSRHTGNANRVFGSIPTTSTNIPLFQIGETFELPVHQVVMNGHIEEDRVIESIMWSFLDQVPDADRQVFFELGYEGIIQRHAKQPDSFFDL